MDPNPDMTGFLVRRDWHLHALSLSLSHTHTHTRLGEDTGRRQSSINQGEGLKRNQLCQILDLGLLASVSK